jgi:dephospho-CoA kinase
MNKGVNKTGLAAGRPSASMQKLSMEDEPVLVRINAQVTDAEHQKLKIHAAKNKTSISKLLRAFIATLPD